MEKITIERDEKYGWTVKQGDRYADWMGWDEMLGLLTALTFPDDFKYYRECWMKTEEQHRKTEPWRYREEKPKEILLIKMKQG